MALLVSQHTTDYITPFPSVLTSIWLWYFGKPSLAATAQPCMPLLSSLPTLTLNSRINLFLSLLVLAEVYPAGDCSRSLDMKFIWTMHCCNENKKSCRQYIHLWALIFIFFQKITDAIIARATAGSLDHEQRTPIMKIPAVSPPSQVKGVPLSRSLVLLHWKYCLVVQRNTHLKNEHFKPILAFHFRFFYITSTEMLPFLKFTTDSIFYR